MAGFRPYDPNSSSGGGGIPDAPNDGLLYGRQSLAWAEIPSAVQIAGATGTPVYQWLTDTSATDPTQGFVKANNSDLSLVTELYVSATLDSGFVLSEALKEYYLGDFISISDFTDSNNALFVIVTGDTVDNGGWFTIPVAVSYSSGTLTNLEDVSVSSLSTSTRAPRLTVERLYDGESSILVQEPSALDTAQYIQFGATQGAASDPIQTLAQGGDSEASILRINQAGTYRIKTAIQYGRETSAGTAVLNFRVTINGVQAGRSINTRLQNANQTSIFTDEAWLTVPAGLDIIYEVIRDSSGSNSGGLIAGETSGSTGWNAAPSASVRVERWR